MKINKQFILEVANGKYSDYDMHGEMQRIARRILEEKVVAKFQTFCFRTYGDLDNVCDIYDAFTDFAGFGAEIKVTVPRSIHPAGYWQVFGMTAEESLENLYRDSCGNDTLYDALCGASFKIRGEKGAFQFNSVACRHAFDKGHISGKQAVEYCRVA